ncbi:DacC D-alanyl-D-alanine carboxypeptidase [Sphingomonadaceae bacterium]
MRACLFLPLLAIAIPVKANGPLPQSTAPIAYLVDLNSGTVLVDRKSGRQVPTASMAKMMTAFVAFEAIKARKISLQTEYKVSGATWTRWNNRGSTMFLKANQKVSVENLLHGVLTLSGNDASVVLAEGISGSEAAFAGEMNAAAKRLGMKDSRFGNASGWPDGGKTVSTAQDLSLLAEHIIEDHPQLFEMFFGQRSFRWGNVTQSNRNPLLGAVAGADGMKTGHSSEAGYCLVGTAKQDDRRLLMVIAGLPSAQARIDEARLLMRWGFDNWVERPLFAPNQMVTNVPVQLGEAMVVPVATTQRIAALSRKGAIERPRISVSYDGPVKAPIRKGQKIAELSLLYEGGKVQRFPLVAADSVERANFLGRALNGMRLLAEKL